MTRNLGIGLWSWISFRVVRASRPCLCWCRPVGCVSCVGRWCGRTCPANTPGVGSWYGALVLVCSAAGSFARGGDAIQAASHTLRRGAAFRVARGSRPCVCWCRPVGCVSWGEGVGRWRGRTCPVNTPGVGSWYGVLVLVCSAAGSFARGAGGIQAASHTLRRDAAFRVARASRPCWWDCATFQVALPRARSIWLSAVDDGAGAIGGGDPSLPVVFDAALDETDAQSSLLNLSDRSQPSSCHRSHEMDM